MKLFIKNNIKFIIVIVICLIGSSITTLATNYIFNSNEVSYDNTESGLHADEVQGAIDEVFQHATDYSEIKNTIGTGSLTTTSNTLIGGVNELNGKSIKFDTYTSTSSNNGNIRSNVEVFPGDKYRIAVGACLVDNGEIINNVAFTPMIYSDSNGKKYLGFHLTSASSAYGVVSGREMTLITSYIEY